MKKLLIPVLALGLIGSVATIPAAPASAAAVVVKIGAKKIVAKGHHRRHVCHTWGTRNHARYCRAWRWENY